MTKWYLEHCTIRGSFRVPDSLFAFTDKAARDAFIKEHGAAWKLISADSAQRTYSKKAFEAAAPPMLFAVMWSDDKLRRGRRVIRADTAHDAKDIVREEQPQGKDMVVTGQKVFGSNWHEDKKYFPKEAKYAQKVKETWHYPTYTGTRYNK